MIIKIDYTPGDRSVVLYDARGMRSIESLTIPIRELEHVIDMLLHAKWLADVHEKFPPEERD